jgi:hypothetical protein
LIPLKYAASSSESSVRTNRTWSGRRRFGPPGDGDLGGLLGLNTSPGLCRRNERELLGSFGLCFAPVDWRVPAHLITRSARTSTGLNMGLNQRSVGAR